jgi:glycylpeptide N-tetradecanoyltransferase
VAYLFYYFSGSDASLESLVLKALHKSQTINIDVFNALDIMENQSFLKNLGFVSGDGRLHYYLYNWKTNELTPKDIGFLLF